MPLASELAPFAADLRLRLRDLEDEFRRSLGPQAQWDPEQLRLLLPGDACRAPPCSPRARGR